MARNALGQFTRRASPRRSGRRRLGLPGNRIEGTEVGGVTTGEAIVLGGGETDAATESRCEDAGRPKS